MSALDRILQRVDALNFDNRVVALIENLKRYNVLDKPIETEDGSLIEVIMAVCAELDLMDLRIMRIEETLASVNSADKKVNEKMSAPVGEDVAPQAMQQTIDGGEEPHAEVAEKANPAPKKTAGGKKKA